MLKRLNSKFFSNQHMIPFVVSLASFMEALDTTIINTAIPSMSVSLQVNPVDLKIALISYLLSLAIFIPISGWMADKFGIKKVFIVALIIFTISSFWCGYTNNLTELVIARCLQGLGGSHMMPLGRLIILRTFARHELINTMTRVIMVAALGMMLGPVLGGIITHYFTWRWIFWVNIPVGIFAVLLSAYCLKESKEINMPPLDKLGFILFGSGLSALTFSLSAFSESNIKPHYAILILSVAVLFLFCYFWHSRTQPHPILNTKVFESRTFFVSITGNLLSRLGFGGIPFLIPLLLQVAFGYSAQLSGFLLAPTALGVLLVKPFSVTILRMLGYRTVLILNTILVSLSILIISTITINTPIYVIGLYTFLFGFLISMQFSAMNSLAYAQLPPERLSSATSIVSTTQQLSQSFGVAVGALLLGYFSPVSIESKFVLTSEVFHHAFLAMSLLTLAASLIFLQLKEDDGSEMIRQEISS